jgi:ABC-2 type transport system permease protein
MSWFSPLRFFAVFKKEVIQMRRDPMTFAMTIMIPIMQLILFSYAINNNPRHLPTVVMNASPSVFTRAFLANMEETKYFNISQKKYTDAKANALMKANKLQFIVHIPPHFSEDLVRGRHPSILVTADATDSVATASAMSALNQIVANGFNKVLQGPLDKLQTKSAPVGLIIHARYNPLSITRYNIVPGLLGVVLTLTLAMITAMALTREYESGTIESLLATPIKPFEVMLGKIIPYILLGFIQVCIILSISYFVFAIPFVGSLFLLMLACFLFIVTNLSVGLLFSSISKTQLQASQYATFFFLPSLLLSGFMFPFQGMPYWAQAIGNCLPLTHFLRITRGIMLKGATFWPLAHDFLAIILFCFVILLLNVLLYRRTLS